MTDLVGIASNAVAAYQRALGTVSNNIANVATEGYSRQAVVLQANPVAKTGNVYMGTGVMVDRIQRQYDAFAEANLRNSSSDLASQEPMVNYANRVVDVMGGQTMGLTGALDQFFASARDLSADPASSVARSSFVRDAQGLASRFGQLSSQLDLVQEETTQAVSSSVGQMNTIIKQLAEVNTQLSANRTASAQPAALLDQRDKLLKNLSDFAHVNTRFNENGSVLVSLGPSLTKDIVVDGNKAYSIAANFNSAAPEKVSLVLDPYGNPSSLSSISSGSLAGLMTFREQVLGSTRSALDTLASTMVREVNAVHQQGVDGYGEAAGALFGIDPAATTVAGGVQVLIDDPMRVAAAAQFRVIKDANNTGGADASISYQVDQASGPADLASTLVNNPNPSADRSFTLSDGRPFAAITTVPAGMQSVSLYLDGASAGQQLQVFTRDGRQLIGQALNADMQKRVLTTDNGFAAGAGYSSTYLFGDANLYGAKQTILLGGTSTGTLSFLGQSVAGSASGNTAAQSAALIVANKATIMGGASATAEGITDIAVDPKNSSRLIITSASTSTARAAIAAASNSGITFGAGTPPLYKDLTVFYGAKADVLQAPIYDKQGVISGYTPVAPSLAGGRISALADRPVIAAGAFVLNGVALGALLADCNATGIAAWINASNDLINPPATGVTATATNEIRVSASQLKLDKPLELNGTTITMPSGGYASVQTLANAINAQAASTNVVASISRDGELVLTNTTGHEGEDIQIGPANMAGTTVNALGIKADLYTGQVTLHRSLSSAGDTTPIEFGFGSSGTPAALAKLGFRTGAYISGTVPDDLLVFATGTGTGTASVAASYSGAAVDAKQALRQQPMTVTFSTTGSGAATVIRYTITDTKTNTVVAERTLDPSKLNPAVTYQGLQLSLTSAPKQGDVFTLDGNADGTGNNDNMLAMAALESKSVIGSKTLTNAYIDHVNEMGNIARQATIAKAALTVVHDQAITTHDQVSGVSLDQEAADLIRFQQAYQASAKILQVAGQLFDSILQVR